MEVHINHWLPTKKIIMNACVGGFGDQTMSLKVRKIIIESRFSTYGCAFLLRFAQDTVCKQRPHTGSNSNEMPPSANG
jgi:hypothetical protein